MTQNQLIRININNDTNIIIQKTLQNNYTIQWDDGVINEWEETYPTLSSALTRAANIAACGETNWEKGFNTTNSNKFHNHAAEFLNQQTT